MNREIKFRAWDYAEEKMFYSDSDFNHRHGSCYDEQYGDELWLALENIENIDSSGEVQLMQYTGLKDKNGVKIFEGDICKSKNGLIGCVKYMDMDAAYHFPHKNGSIHVSALLADGLLHPLEVIGNIYENPELLNEDE